MQQQTRRDPKHTGQEEAKHNSFFVLNLKMQQVHQNFPNITGTFPDT